MKIRRINLFGGPGVGKSTTAARLYSDIKELSLTREFSVELVREVAKDYAYAKVPIDMWEQWRVFINQLLLERRTLEAVDVIITDSPLYQNAYYGFRAGSSFNSTMFELAMDMAIEFKSLDLFLERESRPYVTNGRFQDEETSRKMDKHLYDVISGYTNPQIFTAVLYSNILNYVLERLF